MAEKKQRTTRVKPAAPAATTEPAAPAPAQPQVAAAQTQRRPASKSAIAIKEGRGRAVIDAVLPAVDGGRYPIKRIVAEPVFIEAHCFTDGHDKIRAVLTWGLADGSESYDVEMTAQVNDVWTAQFTPPTAGRYRYTVTAWVDPLGSWRSELERRDDPDDVRIALQVGAGLIDKLVERATNDDRAALAHWAAALREAAAATTTSQDVAAMKALALDTARAAIAERHADRSLATSLSLELIADRKRAGFSSWYELFPRSAAAQAGVHGTFRDVASRLPYVAQMGFDVLYFPPIHPIGRVNRKGKNNKLVAQPDDVGSPWAIGAAEGGHKDILPELGTLQDFKDLNAKARELGIDIALDIAFQCAPDHPYVKEHPRWFKHRPDGSVQYAENPPKKYQDIYPFDFESEDWRGLWDELKSVIDFWILQGVRIFRVDNPHTKSFAFWEWAIGEVKRAQPDVIFLAEAFTRPKVMHRLAKVGFTQSYTYYTWRNTKYELTEYFTELSSAPGADYFRPNVWPNTPDILHESLQSGLRAVYCSRLVLAATLAANYGIYGPTFELRVSAPRGPGSEEYLDSEKYQLRHWDLNQADSLAPLIARVNQIRRENVALQSDKSLKFCPVENDQLIAYVKHDEALQNVILTVVNLDPHNTQSGWVGLDLAALGIGEGEAFQVHDLLSNQRFEWRGRYNFVSLEPWRMPAHVFLLRKLVRSERNFEYFS